MVGVKCVEQSFRMGGTLPLGTASLETTSVTCSSLAIGSAIAPLFATGRRIWILQRSQAAAVVEVTPSTLRTVAVLGWRSGPIVTTCPSTIAGRASAPAFTHLAHGRRELLEFLATELIVSVFVEAIEKLARIGWSCGTSPAVLPITPRQVGSVT
jgi:hypothetical protein